MGDFGSPKAWDYWKRISISDALESFDHFQTLGALLRKLQKALFDKGRWNESDVDLTGGYYDAGDNIKLGYPLAFSLTSLSWGLLHYWDSYIAMGQIDEMLDLIKWGVDWLLKAVVIRKGFSLAGTIDQ